VTCSVSHMKGAH